MPENIMDKETFFTGLLLRLQPDQDGDQLREFSTSSDVLSKAFSAALQTARTAKDGPRRIMGIDWDVADDPVRQARFVTELIAFGMSSRLLRLYNVDLETALPRRRPPSARDRLAKTIGHASWFGEVGEVFVSNLK